MSSNPTKEAQAKAEASFKRKADQARDGKLASAEYEAASRQLREEFARRKDEWLPTMEDREYVRSLMHPVFEPGKIANWIAPPATGIKGKPFEFEYVRL